MVVANRSWGLRSLFFPALLLKKKSDKFQCLVTHLLPASLWLVTPEREAGILLPEARFRFVLPY